MLFNVALIQRSGKWNSMSKTYIQVDFSIVDLDGLRPYLEKIPGLIKKHGGRYLVRGPEPQVIKADAEVLERNVILEFPSKDVAEAFLEERKATGLTAIWEKNTKSRILILEGMD